MRKIDRLGETSTQLPKHLQPVFCHLTAGLSLRIKPFSTIPFAWFPLSELRAGGRLILATELRLDRRRDTKTTAAVPLQNANSVNSPRSSREPARFVFHDCLWKCRDLLPRSRSVVFYRGRKLCSDTWGPALVFSGRRGNYFRAARRE